MTMNEFKKLPKTCPDVVCCNKCRYYRSNSIHFVSAQCKSNPRVRVTPKVCKTVFPEAHEKNKNNDCSEFEQKTRLKLPKIILGWTK